MEKKKNLGLITPGKSFAEALTASSCSGKKSMSGEYVAPLDDQKSNASPTNLEKVFITSPKTDEPVEKVPLEHEKNNKRQRWSEEEKEEVVRCFYLAKNKGLSKVKGTYSIWRERNPEKHTHICEVRLNTQYGKY